ncbi:hypothetical protein ACGFX4_06515 [Kitasatospora sp. NPDC048365]|uniref:hypothetical protein n=1 Tax=Kitasatospora sp. NPDC048365 TaxID=3364050 RepID=UPI003721513E
MQDFETIADGLYALPPGGFTAARDAAAAEARKAGDRELAGRLKALRRPTLAAFAVNLLVRRHREEVGPLLELGRALREAQEQLAGPTLRDLSAQRHRLVAALTGQARLAAADAGERLGEAHLREVEQTLRAALADERAAEAVVAGRLTGALDESAALSPAPTDHPVRGRSAGGGPTTPRKKAPAASRQSGTAAAAPDEAARREALARVTETRAALAAAEQAQLTADRDATLLGDQVEQLAAETTAATELAERARESLAQAEQHLARARRAEQVGLDEHRTALRQASSAARTTERARQELDRAQTRLERLSPERPS